MGYLLEVEDLKVIFKTSHGPVEAVKGVNFHLFEGETLAIVGESGCGKSVTALSVMGLLRKEQVDLSGKILFEGINLPSLPERAYRKIRGRRMGIVFQDPMTSLNPLMRIGYQITETITRHKRVTNSEARRRAYTLLERVGIAEPDRRFNQYPHEFSGGMRQRVMIALALACEPCLLIADEPTTALDMTIQAQIFELLKSLQEETGTTILLITHDLGVVAQIADRMVVMYAGAVVEEGPTEALFKEPGHPYTKGLLGSVPRRTEKKEALVTIPGSPPDLLKAIEGCPFVPRCPYAMEICKSQKAHLAKIEQTRKSACWLHDPRAEKQKLLFMEPL